MNTRRYSTKAQARLKVAARTEVQYLVPDYGPAYTLDPEQADRWASIAARRASSGVVPTGRPAGAPIAILTRTATFTTWTVASERVSAELERN